MDSSAFHHGKHVGNFESNKSTNWKMKEKDTACFETEEHWPLSDDKPFMHFIMAEYHVNSPYQLVVPKKIHSKLPEARIPVVLKCRNKKWWTSFHGDGNKRLDVTGWRIFAIENELKEGDGCVFEMTDWSSRMIMFKVQILSGEMPSELLERCGDGSSDDPITIT